MPIPINKVETFLVFGIKHVPIALMGHPGLAKSAIAVRAARRRGGVNQMVYTATLEAVDVLGVPYLVKEGQVQLSDWASPVLLPIEPLRGRFPENRPITVILDDLFQAHKSVQKPLMRAIHSDDRENRYVGRARLLPNVDFIITGNRKDDRAGVDTPETYVGNRLAFLEVTSDAASWCSQALSGFQLPSEDEDYRERQELVDKEVAKGLPEFVVGYVRWKKQFPVFEASSRSNFTPRSAELFGKLYRVWSVLGLEEDVLMECAAGTIGEANAAELIGFMRSATDLPDLGEVLKGGDYKLNPEKPEVLYVTAASVIKLAKKEHAKGIGKFLIALSRLQNKKGMHTGVEIAGFIFSECMRSNQPLFASLTQDKTVSGEWIAKYGKYFST